MGWNRPTSNTVDATSSSRPSGRGKMPRLRKGLLAGAIVVVLGLAMLAILFCGENASAAKAEKRLTAIRDEKRMRPGAVDPKIVGTDAVIRREDHQMPAEPKQQTNVPAAGETNEVGIVRQRPISGNAVDGIIAMFVSGEDGDIPPLPGIGPECDAQLREAVKKPIEFLPDDDEATKELKKKVMEWRFEILELMDKGQSFADILNNHRELLEHNKNLRLDAEREMYNIIKEGDIEAARAYYDKVNNVLDGMGVKQMTKPPAIMNDEELEAYRKERWEFFHGEGRRKRMSERKPMHYK